MDIEGVYCLHHLGRLGLRRLAVEKGQGLVMLQAMGLVMLRALAKVKGLVRVLVMVMDMIRDDRTILPRIQDYHKAPVKDLVMVMAVNLELVLDLVKHKLSLPLLRFYQFWYYR